MESGDFAKIRKSSSEFPKGTAPNQVGRDELTKRLAAAKTELLSFKPVQYRQAIFTAVGKVPNSVLGSQHLALGEKRISCFDKAPCGSCGETGQTFCSSCNGTQQRRCGNCQGRGDFQCSSCFGHGYKVEQTYEGGRSVSRNVTCITCYGNGEFACNHCRSRGYTQCNICSGGVVICSNCSGVGALVAEYYFKVNASLSLRQAVPNPIFGTAKNIQWLASISEEYQAPVWKDGHDATFSVTMANYRTTAQLDDNGKTYECTFWRSEPVVDSPGDYISEQFSKVLQGLGSFRNKRKVKQAMQAPIAKELMQNFADGASEPDDYAAVSNGLISAEQLLSFFDLRRDVISHYKSLSEALVVSDLCQVFLWNLFIWASLFVTMGVPFIISEHSMFLLVKPDIFGIPLSNSYISALDRTFDASFVLLTLALVFATPLLLSIVSDRLYRFCARGLWQYAFMMVVTYPVLLLAFVSFFGVSAGRTWRAVELVDAVGHNIGMIPSALGPLILVALFTTVVRYRRGAVLLYRRRCKGMGLGLPAPSKT